MPFPFLNSTGDIINPSFPHFWLPGFYHSFFTFDIPSLSAAVDNQKLLLTPLQPYFFHVSILNHIL
jgi:hypothetical protein